MDLETMTVKELQDRLVELGMDSEEAEAFKTKASIVSTIKLMESKDAVDSSEVEVKKVATLEERPNPSEDREVNKNWKNKAEAMKARLLAQPTVSILIPLEAAEKAGVVEWRTDKNGERYQYHVSGAIESVQLNGYKYFIPKGRYTPVPQQVAEVISKSQQQTLEAGSNISLDRIDERTGRPLNEVL